MHKNVLALLFLLLRPASVMYSAQQQASPDLVAQLSQRVDTYNLHAGSFVEALAQVAGEFRIPMGIVWIDRPSAKGNLSFSWVGATVQEIIEEIVVTQYGYQLRISNGVVHVSSADIPPDQNFLRIRIGKFAVHHEVLPVATRSLQDLLRTTISPPKGSANIGRGSSLGTNTDEAKIDLQQVENTTVEEILDSLVAVSDSKIWIVTFEDSFILSSGGFRRTSSLWSGSSVPDTEQPVWDMFRWRRPIPTRALRDK
jgi:hypothetical protein